MGNCRLSHCAEPIADFLIKSIGLDELGHRAIACVDLDGKRQQRENRGRAKGDFTSPNHGRNAEQQTADENPDRHTSPRRCDVGQGVAFERGRDHETSRHWLRSHGTS